MKEFEINNLIWGLVQANNMKAVSYGDYFAYHKAGLTFVYACGRWYILENHVSMPVVPWLEAHHAH